MRAYIGNGCYVECKSEAEEYIIRRLRDIDRNIKWIMDRKKTVL